MELGNTDFLKNNKRFIGPIVLFVLSLFIVLRVIIPMISSISQERRDLVETKIKLEKLNDSQSAIQTINQDNVVENIELTKKALPMNKEIIQIYSTVVDIASKNNMQVKAFSVKVGQVYSQDNSTAPVEGKPEDQGFPVLDIRLGVDAQNTESLFQFSNDMMQALPLVRINKFTTSENSGDFDVSFYYKPLNDDALAKQEFVTPLNESEEKSLQTIEKFDQN
jgi:hypothetical protein